MEDHLHGDPGHQIVERRFVAEGVHEPFRQQALAESGGDAPPTTARAVATVRNARLPASAPYASTKMASVSTHAGQRPSRAALVMAAGASRLVLVYAGATRFRVHRAVQVDQAGARYDVFD